MKRGWLQFSLVVLFMTVLVAPAAAIHFDVDLSADCKGYEITVTGKSWVPYTADFSLSFDDGSSAGGGSFALIPDAANNVDTVFSGSWSHTPSGTVTVTGSYELTGRATDPVFTGDFTPVTLDCPDNSCNWRSRWTKIIKYVFNWFKCFFC